MNFKSKSAWQLAAIAAATLIAGVGQAHELKSAHRDRPGFHGTHHYETHRHGYWHDAYRYHRRDYRWHHRYYRDDHRRACTPTPYSHRESGPLRYRSHRVSAYEPTVAHAQLKSVSVRGDLKRDRGTVKF